jgi:hypothetical protein
MATETHVKWEYLFVQFWDWEVRYINEKTPKERWRKLPVSECINQLGEQGWDLVNFAVVSSSQFLVFKRPKV